MTPLPLEDIRVLDLTRVLAGPLCTMLLGDLGADVIKVERPDRGDDTRGWGPPFDSRGESAYYLSINRNKLSVAADLASPEGRTLVQSLAADADVVVENFLPGALERFGLSVATALRQSPKLVWCSITGFGAGNPRPGYDFVVQAESGWMHITGEKRGEPMKTGVALADILAGKDAAIAILGALTAISRGKEPRRHVVISLADTARAALVNVAQNTLVTGIEARRWGNAHANLVPYQLFHARDRDIVIAVGSDEQWIACVRALGLSELENNRSLATNAGRLAHRELVVTALERQLERKTADEWLTVLAEANVPSGVVKTVLEALEDARTPSALTGMPSSVGGESRLPPPRLDEHGELIRSQGWGVFERYR
jgi:crotonobetainyl-CoA:carnitine CoA-transferase CaiB-like acyl-CoA transferase